jgi:hypothetical protein
VRLVLQARELRELQVYLELTELLGLRVFAVLLEAPGPQANKGLLGYKVLLVLVLQAQQESVQLAQLALQELLEWSALAELQD